MPIETIKVDLEDDDYALMYVELRHGTYRRVQEIYAPHVKSKEAQDIIRSANNGDKEGMDRIYEVVGSATFLAATDAMILGQVKEWSFGEVTQRNLDEVPERKRDILSKKCDELYASPLALSGGGN